MADTGNRFSVEIISPERVFYSGEADMVEFNTTEGEIGIYKNHIPLTAVLAPGVITITEGEQKKWAAIHSGFAEILGDKVTLLAEIAEWPDEIDVERAKESESRARRRLEERAGSLNVLRAEVSLKKSLVRQEVAEKK